MDRLRALEFIDSRSKLIDAKDDLKIRVAALLRIVRYGGTFAVDRDLISFVNVLIDNGHTTAVLIDSLDNPIEISDLESFNRECISRYFEATNLYHCEYSKLSKQHQMSSANDFSDHR